MKTVRLVLQVICICSTIVSAITNSDATYGFAIMSLELAILCKLEDA